MSLNFLISSSGESFELQSNKINEIKNIIGSKTKSKYFLLIKENGKKLSKKSLEKEFISEEKINILIIPYTSFDSQKPLKENINEILNNQLLAKKIFDNLYKKKIEKINKTIIDYDLIYKDFKYLMNRIDIDYSSDFEKLKKLYSNINDENFTNILNKIENAKIDFKNHFSIFEDKFRNLQLSFENTKKNYEKIINENKNFYNENSSLSYSELLNIYENNKLLLNKLNENEINSLNNDLNSEMKEFNLLKKKIDENYNLSMIVFNFIEKKEEIEEEIEKRKNFDYIYNTFLNFLQTNLLTEENSRREEFIKKMTRTSISIETYNNILKCIINNNKDINSENQNNKQFDILFNEFKKKFKNLQENKNLENEIENEDSNTKNIKRQLSNILSENLKIPIDDNSSINNLIKKIEDETKNLFVNKSFTYSLILDKTNSTNQELNVFINKYEDIIYFYKSLIEFIKQFYSKLNLELPEITSPSSLTEIIEQKFKENIQLKMHLKYLFSKINIK